LIATIISLAGCNQHSEERRRIQNNQSKNNMKQITLGLHNYHDAYGKFPDVATVDSSGKPLLSWRVQLLPYLGQNDLYQQFNLAESWDSPHNKSLIPRMPSDFSDPNNNNSGGKTRYQIIQGPKTIFEGGKGKTIRDITDGTSNTVLYVEMSADRAVEWTKPNNVYLTSPGSELFNINYFKVAFADGSVETLNMTAMTPQTFLGMLTATGGEEIEPYLYYSDDVD